MRAHTKHRPIIANAGVALAVVANAQHQRGDWADLTVDQLHQIGEVIRADRHSRLTRDECVTRLRTIGGWTPDEAA